MIFSSVPGYLDHPNWQQLQQHLNNQQGSGSENSQLPLPSTPPSQAVGGGGGGCGSIRPGSMVDRARLAKLPLPEAGLKCPRCDSSNTKFCYFNNYNLTQPRHFCKTCRRYWTRGGALRNVPVGGGCRRGKKNKSSSSKSSVTSEIQMGSNSTSASPSNCSTDMNAHQFPHLPSSAAQLPLMAAALHNPTQFNGGNNINIFSNVDGFQAQMIGTGNSNHTDVGIHMGNNSAGGSDHCRLPFFAGLEAPVAGLFPFQTGVETQSFLAGESQQLRSMPSRSLVSHLAPVKMQDNGGLNNLPRQFLGISENNQHWGGNTWTEFPGFNSSSATNHFL